MLQDLYIFFFLSIVVFEILVGFKNGFPLKFA